LVFKENQGRKEILAMLVRRGLKATSVQQAIRASKAHQENQVPKETKATREILVRLVPLAP
jgi:hypothetical protein